MSDRDWPADPTDPQCPSCGEPVSATGSFCMHCEADLPAGGFGPAEATATTADSAAAPGSVDEADPGMPTGDQPVAQSGWLHPDSAFDDASTATVGIVGGLFDGFLVGLLAAWALPPAVQSSWTAALAVLGWLLSTAWIAWTRSVFGAVRKAAYSFAVLVALAPLFLGYALADPGVLSFGIVAWPVAGIAAGGGWVAGRGALEDGG